MPAFHQRAMGAGERGSRDGLSIMLDLHRSTECVWLSIPYICNMRAIPLNKHNLITDWQCVCSGKSLHAHSRVHTHTNTTGSTYQAACQTPLYKWLTARHLLPQTDMTDRRGPVPTVIRCQHQQFCISRLSDYPSVRLSPLLHDHPSPHNLPLHRRVITPL